MVPADLSDLSSVVDAAPLMVFAFDRDGTLRLSQGGALRTVGLRTGHVGSSVFDLYRGYPDIVRAARNALAGNSVRVHFNVSGVTLASHFRPVHDEDGCVIGVVGTTMAAPPDVEALSPAAHLSGRRLQAVADLGRLAAAQDDLGAVLDHVTRTASRLLGPLAVLRLLPPDQSHLATTAVHHPHTQMRELVVEALQKDLPLDSGETVRRVVVEGETVILSDVENFLHEMPETHRLVHATYPVSGLIIAPLRGRSGVIGVLSVCRHEGAQPFDEDDACFLDSLAERAAVAIENTRLLEAAAAQLRQRREAERALEMRLRQQAGVAQLAREALERHDLDDLLELATNLVADNLNVELVSVLELLPDRSGLLVRAGAGWADNVVGEVVVSADEHSQSGFTLASAESVVVTDTVAETRFRVHPVLREAGVQSGMSVGIGTGDRAFGVLAAYSRRRAHFTDDDIAFLQSTAGILAAAVERRRAESSLRDLSEDRRQLIGRLVRAGEQERRRIAAEIHDDSIQIMTALAIRLSTLQRDLADPAQSALVRQLESAAIDTVSRLRALLIGLRPPDLGDTGFRDALSSQLEDLCEGNALRWEIDEQLVAPLEVEDLTVLHRIAQEAVANVVRHAEASHVRVSLRDEAGAVVLEVRDDGVGPPATERRMRGHLGLTTMRERAAMAGGELTVERNDAGGTTVRARLPRTRPSSAAADGRRGD